MNVRLIRYAKFQRGNFMNPNKKKDIFRKLKLCQNKFVSIDSIVITTKINDQLNTNIDFRKHLRQSNQHSIHQGRNEYIFMDVQNILLIYTYRIEIMCINKFTIILFQVIIKQFKMTPSILQINSRIWSGS